MSAILCAEFGGSFFGMEPEETVVFLYLVLPFGWRASPGYFSLVGGAITLAHSNFAPRDSDRDGIEHFESQIFSGDAIFIEPTMGLRLANVVGCWEYVCRRILGSTSINLDKLTEEGDWQESQIILGFEVNVEELIIKPPEVKICNATEAIMDNMIGPGNMVVTVKCVQTLGGLFNHWRYSNRSWHHFAAPINGLLSYADSTNTCARCDNIQARLTFRDLILFLRNLRMDTDLWRSLPQGRLEDLIPPPQTHWWR